MPKAYGGFGTDLKFYGFDFSVSFAYQFGGKIRDYSYQDLMHNGNSNDMVAATGIRIYTTHGLRTTAIPTSRVLTARIPIQMLLPPAG